MADKNKLYITITDDRGDGNGTPIPKPDGPKRKSEESDTLGRYIEHEMFHFAKQQVTQFVNYQISNIGNFTGDYITQSKVNSVKQAISGLTTIGMTTLAGAKYGPYGAAIGFVVGAITQMASGLYEENTNRIANQKANYDISQIRERAGLNTTRDGSRGTEN